MDQSSQFFLHSTLVFFLLFPSTRGRISNMDYDVVQARNGAKYITVDQSGKGDFRTIKEAIDSVPQNNNNWIIIKINPGTYNEKVIIPREKPNIFLRGGGESRTSTRIQFSDGGSSTESAVLQVNANNFICTDIEIKNTYNLPKQFDANGNPKTWAPAVLLNADMVAFLRCNFLSLQDTVSDILGRHYLEDCFIQGSVDFIWGSGQSVYKGCTLKSLDAGYMTAQGRSSASEPTGFVFISCTITGTGPTYLGRAYRPYSRVIFYDTYMENIIQPEGWSAWGSVGKEDSITYAEENCRGPGANKSKRVKWMKHLRRKDLGFFTDVNTYLGGNWMYQLPN
ncbi:hypothetical protein SLA2020_436060 [Shorea laevis]